VIVFEPGSKSTSILLLQEVNNKKRRERNVRALAYYKKHILHETDSAKLDENDWIAFRSSAFLYQQ